MKLSDYLTQIKCGLKQSLAFADEPTRALAERLLEASESSINLAFTQFAHDLTQQLNTQLTNLAVTQIQLHGNEIDITSTPCVPISVYESLNCPENPNESSQESSNLKKSTGFKNSPDQTLRQNTEVENENNQVRITLRLPQTLKEELESTAANNGDSLNSYIVKTLKKHTHIQATQNSEIWPERIRSWAANIHEQTRSFPIGTSTKGWI